jgi:hypothetical protein
MHQVVFVRLLFSVPVNFRFALAVKIFPTFSSISLLLNLGANPFISSKHFTRAFFILASTKLRCLLIIILPALVITTPNLGIFLFCQHNSTCGGNFELRQNIITYVLIEEYVFYVSFITFFKPQNYY